MAEEKRFKHYDRDGAEVSLHDSYAEKVTFENGVLSFYFPEDALWVHPNHEANPTGETVRSDACEVRFQLLYGEEEDVTVHVFTEKKRKATRKAVREEWQLSKLMEAVNSGEYKLEFCYQYRGGWRVQLFDCYLYRQKKPLTSKECQLWITVEEITYCWNEVQEDRAL